MNPGTCAGPLEQEAGEVRAERSGRAREVRGRRGQEQRGQGPERSGAGETGQRGQGAAGRVQGTVKQSCRALRPSSEGRILKPVRT